MDKVTELAGMIKKIENGEIEVVIEVQDGESYIRNDEVEVLAIEALITSGGRCNWLNIFDIRERGYNVYPGERDSFGWVTGCIRTSKGIIVYG